MWDPRRLTPGYMDKFTLRTSSSLELQRCVGLHLLYGIVTANFSKVQSLASYPTPNLKDQGLYFAWPLSFDLSGMGDHSRRLRSRQHNYPGHCGVRVYTKQTNSIELSLRFIIVFARTQTGPYPEPDESSPYHPTCL
jgi:hypothetical protein